MQKRFDDLSGQDCGPYRVVLDDGSQTNLIYDQGRVRKMGSNRVLDDWRSLSPLVICDDTLKKLPIGANVPPKVIEVQNAQTMRMQFVSGVRGKGLEFGGGFKPAHFPLGVAVKNVDRFQTDEMVSQSSSAGKQRALTPENRMQPMPVDIVDSLDDMSQIPLASQDFIYASHVIEHVQDPIGAVRKALNRLKPNGQLLLVVPHKDWMFDRFRSLTSLAHLIDINMNGVASTLGMYLDSFMFIPKHSRGRRFADMIAEAKAKAEAHADIHFHTFTPESFSHLLDYVAEMDGPLTKEVTPAPDESFKEFYVKVVKQA